MSFCGQPTRSSPRPAGGGGGSSDAASSSGGGSSTASHVPKLFEVKGFVHSHTTLEGALEGDDSVAPLTQILEGADPDQKFFIHTMTINSAKNRVMNKKLFLYLTSEARQCHATRSAALAAVKKFLDTDFTISEKKCFVTLEPPAWKRALNSKVGRALNILKGYIPEKSLKAEWVSSRIYFKSEGEWPRELVAFAQGKWVAQDANLKLATNSEVSAAVFLVLIK